MVESRHQITFRPRVAVALLVALLVTGAWTVDLKSIGCEITQFESPPEEARFLPSNAYITVVTLVGGWVHPNQVEEWFWWHRSVGVDKVIIHGLNTEPELRSAMIRLNKTDGAEVILREDNHNPNVWQQNRFGMKWKRDNQASSYSRSIKENRNKTEWIVFIDIDEFISPGSDPGTTSLVQWLRGLKQSIVMVELRWSYIIIPDYVIHHKNSSGFGSSKKDWKPVTLEYGLVSWFGENEPKQSSGKTLVRLASGLFSDKNHIHSVHRLKENDFEWGSKFLRPSIKLSNGHTIPRCPHGCVRGSDNFVLAHFRRADPRMKKIHAANIGKNDEKVIGPKSTHSKQQCALIAATCSALGACPGRPITRKHEGNIDIETMQGLAKEEKVLLEQLREVRSKMGKLANHTIHRDE